MQKFVLPSEVAPSESAPSESTPCECTPAEIQFDWAQHGSLADVLKQVRSGQPPSFCNPTGIAIIISGIVLGMPVSFIKI
jgi:hypothetical protein